jgi:hypothetical protein
MKTTYHVLDHGEPATWHSCIKSLPQMSETFKKTWANNIFSSLEEARQYAVNWLGIYAPPPEILKVNCPYDYSGYGDTIEIVEKTT